MGEKDRIERSVNCLAGAVLLQKRTGTLMSVVWEGTLTRLACGHIQASTVQKLRLRVETETAGEGQKWARTYGSTQRQTADASCCCRPLLFRAVIVRWRCRAAQNCWEGRNLHLEVVMCSILKQMKRHHSWHINNHFKEALILFYLNNVWNDGLQTIRDM